MLGNRNTLILTNAEIHSILKRRPKVEINVGFEFCLQICQGKPKKPCFTGPMPHNVSNQANAIPSHRLSHSFGPLCRRQNHFLLCCLRRRRSLSRLQTLSFSSTSNHLHLEHYHKSFCREKRKCHRHFSIQKHASEWVLAQQLHLFFRSSSLHYVFFYGFSFSCFSD